jgi:3,4-dihydroxy 2-butanone 4-phosphate synthase/GTP cyclohydrolase II
VAATAAGLPAATGDGRVQAALTDLAAGRPVLVLRRDRAGGGSGALVLAASMAGPELVAFVVRHTTGFLCVAIDPADATRLGLPPMALENQRADGLCYAVTVDAVEGIGTGISAADRSRTIGLLGDPATVAAQLSRPGHVVPVISAAAGVLGHPGFAEAGRDLVSLAGLHPAALVADLVNDDGSLACPADLLRFAGEQALRWVELGELVSYRARGEWSLERLPARHLPVPHERVQVTEYRRPEGAAVHLAFTCGAPAGRDDVPLYVHPACPDGDLFAGVACDCRTRLDRALSEMEASGDGVLLYLRAPERPAGEERHDRVDLADLVTAANLLRDLGPRSFLLPAWQAEDLLALHEHGVLLRRAAGDPRSDPALALPGAAA